MSASSSSRQPTSSSSSPSSTKPVQERRRSSNRSAGSPEEPIVHDYAQDGEASGSGLRQQNSLTNGHQRPLNPHKPASDASGISNQSFTEDAAQTLHEARLAFQRGTPHAYYMAVVALLCALSQGIPLASMFKVYNFLICEAYDRRDAEAGRGSGGEASVVTNTLHRMISAAVGGSETVDANRIRVPPAPELPHPPQCSSPEVQESTSAYAAVMATVGALVALTVLDRVNKISRSFGRKPIMLLPQLLIAVGFAGFCVCVHVNEYASLVLVFCAVVMFEASAGAPLRISLQNYVVDTTTDSQRASVLSFIEGFGQIGAFPSSTLGGFLAAVTGEFFAPFYLSIAVCLVTFAYVLVLVPESKRHRHHTIIDVWEQSAEAEQRTARQRQREERQERGESWQSTDGMSYMSSEIDDEENSVSTRARWAIWLNKINFVRSCSIFAPKRYGPAAGKRAGSLDFRLLNLAIIVACEEPFQVFLVPSMLLYNSDVFGFDVLQNGYLVSLLQGTRALFLTLIFPTVVTAVRKGISKRVQRRKEEKKKALIEARRERRRLRRESRASRPTSSHGASSTPRSSLVVPPSGDGNRENGGERQGLLSPHRPTFPSRSVSRNRFSYGAVSTADTEDNTDVGGSQITSTTIAKREQRGKLDIFIMIISYLIAAISFTLLALSRSITARSNNSASSTWLLLSLGVIGIQLGGGATSIRTALIVNAVSEDDQSQALAANQVLCTIIAATIPLVTSAVYGLGLASGVPEVVWIFKAVFAAAACLASVMLLITHRGPGAGSGQADSEEEEGEDDDDDDDDDDEEDGEGQHQNEGAQRVDIPGTGSGGNS